MCIIFFTHSNGVSLKFGRLGSEISFPNMSSRADVTGSGRYCQESAGWVVDSRINSLSIITGEGEGWVVETVVNVNCVPLHTRTLGDIVPPALHSASRDQKPTPLLYHPQHPTFLS